ncbi:ABC transporter substrate-binding protein [Erythrobacter rubeus]|uniref:ABC transporter substrate-binding protein n=1 Tax=Erythrobacter rubeus TaxID=2760803 RepID=A0ABR8KLV9_9SPHN|nr:ABC transporter substrate-binding protein [Erythrobacter rubeus]MBD2841463.1 ABC transporter substrate-binding protein [Erythrobacter rubeus]
MPPKLFALSAGYTRLLASLLPALALTGCVEPGSRESEPQAPPTVVSLNPCIDAILVEVAAPQQVLALSHYSRDAASSSIAPDVARQYRFTGGTAEEILALEPDLVLASTFIAPSTRSALERLGLRVETFGSPKSVEESYAQIARVAELTGGESDKLISRIEAAVTGLDEMRAARGDVDTLLWQSGQIVAGEDALVTTMLERGGLQRSVDGERLGQGDYVSLESLLADPPELILIAGKSTGQHHPALQDLSDTRTEALDPSLFYCGGPSLIALAERLERLRTPKSSATP